MNNPVSLTSSIRQEQLNKIYVVVRRARDLTVRYNAIAHRFKYSFEEDKVFRTSKEYITFLEVINALGFFIHGFNRTLSNEESPPTWAYVETQMQRVQKTLEELNTLLRDLSFRTQELSDIEKVHFNREIGAAFKRTSHCLSLIDAQFQYLNSLAA